jgi:hypothetical protein
MPHQILTEINVNLERFTRLRAGLRTKLTGALTIEVLRKHLLAEGLPVSRRDVFIRDIPSELDLLVTTTDATPEYDLLYDPRGVLCALEIKYSGVYDQQVVPRLRKCFDAIKTRCPHVICALVVIKEREGFPHAATSAKLGHKVYTLHTWSGDSANAQETGEWSTLVEDLNALLRSSRRSSR